MGCVWRILNSCAEMGISLQGSCSWEQHLWMWLEVTGFVRGLRQAPSERGDCKASGAVNPGKPLFSVTVYSSFSAERLP